MLPRIAAMLILLAVFAASAGATATGPVDHLLERSEPPPGVVFELVESDRDALEHLIPEVSRYVEALRDRFPGLPIAVVTHGNEQFGLERGRADELSGMHSEVQRLTGEADVSVHACGAYAQMHGVDEDAFPDYVDVAPSGPAQIRNYEELGYVRVRL